MDAQSLRPWLILCRAPGIGGATVRKLLNTFADPASIVAAQPSALRRAGLSEAQIQALQRIDDTAIAADLQWLAQPDCHALTLADPRYPARLRDIAQPPPLLFVQGDPDWIQAPQLAIVGSRHASPQGLENAQAFAAELARRGLTITSGLALGIDGAAHTGALAGGGGTVAVCGTGLDRVYPARHKALAHQIIGSGALLSEFPVGVGAAAENFPRRNRIISGLALGVLVVEAARESGSLITARLALEQGREVFAIPGSIHNPLARGCHSLIRQGAKLVETVDDILVELAPLLGMRRALIEATPAQGADAPRADALSDGQSQLLQALGDELLSVDQLAARLDQPISSLQAALTQLELAGWIAVAAGGRYQRLARREAKGDKPRRLAQNGQAGKHAVAHIDQA
ncbi:MAG TPA: DNA-processing protein DprA [Fontimonas sp.]